MKTSSKEILIKCNSIEAKRMNRNRTCGKESTKQKGVNHEKQCENEELD